MIKLLSISGSPAKGSSTDLLLHEIAATIIRKLEPAHEVELKFIKANELRFVPCQACGKAPTPSYCFYDDDLTNIYPLVAECDCLLFGSPVYFDSVSGQAKMFIDRCNCIRPYDFDNQDPDHSFIKLIKQKRPGGMVVVGGDDIGIEQARRTIAGFFKWIEVVNHGVVAYKSTDDRRIGTAADDAGVMEQARELGEKLASAILNS